MFLRLSTLEKFKITLEQIFLTVGQNNYGNKTPLSYCGLVDARISASEKDLPLPLPSF